MFLSPITYLKLKIVCIFYFSISSISFCQENDSNESYSKFIEQLENDSITSQEKIIKIDSLLHSNEEIELYERIEILNLKAHILSILEKNDEAEKLFIYLKGLLQDSKKYDLIIKVNSKYLVHEFFVGDYFTLEKLAKENIEICKTFNCQPEQLAFSYSNLGINYLIKRKYKEAEAALAISIKHSIDNNLPYLVEKANYAFVLFNLNKPSAAIKNFLEVKKSHKLNGTDSLEEIAIINQYIGYVLSELELIDKSLEYYRKAELEFRKKKNYSRLATLLNNQAEVLLLKKQNVQAEKKILEAKRISDSIFVFSKGNIDVSIAEIALLKRDYKKANKNYKIAKSFFEVEKDSIGIGNSLMLKSTIELKQSEFSKAQYYANLADTIFSVSKAPRYRYKILERLALIHEKKEEYDTAFKLKQTSDSIKNHYIDNIEISKVTELLLTDKPIEEGKSAINNIKRNSNLVWVLVIVILSLCILLLYTKMKRGIRFNSKLNNQGEKAIYRLPCELAEELSIKLETYMATEKPYLDKDLTLSKLAIVLNTNNKKLSTLFNVHLNTNFYDFINHYRIESVVKYFESNEDNKYSILGLAYSCGFKNKGSFYRAFKKFKNCTPGEYIKKLNNKNKSN